MSMRRTLRPLSTPGSYRQSRQQVAASRLDSIKRTLDPTRPAMALKVPTLSLRDGNSIPIIAFGAGTAWFKEEGDVAFDPQMVEMTKSALAAGYRHLDCAEMYGNEEEVGVAIKESHVPRHELFITTKVAAGIWDIPKALDDSLRKLQLDYVDLYLVHEPWFAKSDQDFQTAWKTMEALKKAGKAKSIGVSNFLRPQLEATLKTAVDPPVINQIEYHPYLQRANGYVPWMQQNGIAVEAFKGLTPVARVPDGPLVEPLKRIAKAHSTTETVVMLRWILQKGVVAVTTTRKSERLHEYAKALDITLTSDEMEEISTLGAQHHQRFYFPERYDDNDKS